MKGINKVLVLFLWTLTFNMSGQDINVLQPIDVFDLEYAVDPQISPNGEWVVYQRTGFDIMKDKKKNQLWLLNTNQSTHEKLTHLNSNESQAIWSPSGDRIAFVGSTDEGSEIFVYWLSSGRCAQISQLPSSPASLSWSPDGTHLVFTMKVDVQSPVLIQMPKKPKGAQWADAARITDRLKHESDGSGYISPGFTHIFMISAEGGGVRQLTKGEKNHTGPLNWHPDGQFLFFSSNLTDEWEYDFRINYIYSLDIKSGEIKQLIHRQGPLFNPKVSEDGQYVAYLGFDDKRQTYQVNELYVMHIESGEYGIISDYFDRSIDDFEWLDDSNFLIQYDDHGQTKLARLNIKGLVEPLIHEVGGTSIGRPYPGGSFSISKNKKIAYNQTTPEHPAQVMIYHKGKNHTLTQLNQDLWDNKTLGKTEEIWYTSTVDGRDIQGWVTYPPGYDAAKNYPLLVENHGGPILNYGYRFSAEIQLYAAAGYIVFYPNPRGSTGYGEAFGNLLYHNYPGEDYQDVMDGVDYLIDKGIAHEEALFVAGGSAGGIMTAWITGKNNRFEAAVVAKPVINWISKTLVADNYYGYAYSRYPGQPWESYETYWQFSPLSLVGNVETPTMVMVGMDDLRTPPSEAKQWYHALKLRKVETVLVELPGASHGIARKPSQLISKVLHTLEWCNRYNPYQK